MTYEPPADDERLDPAEEAALAGFSLAEEAGLLEDISVARWDALPEDFCRDHELDRGRLIRRESGTPGHQSASLSLAIVLKNAARSAVEAEMFPCLRASQDLDTMLWDVPGATVRKPDVLVYRCLEDGQTELWARRVVLAVEVVSPSSVATDTGRDNRRTGFESKMTQYALAGIEHYWIVRLKPDDSAIASIEQWRLEMGYRGAYAKVAIWTNGDTADAISTKLPFPIQATWADLEF
jgi:hypothetical protein